MPSDWVDLEDALEQARDMVTTAMVTITPKKPKTPTTFVVEIHGIEEMYKLVEACTKAKTKKKIIDFKVQNLSTFQALTVDDLAKSLGKI